MANKILTLDNLYQFFVEQNKVVHFSSKESKQPIVVTVPGNFEVEETDMPGLLKLQLKVCHTELNRNGSFISEEHMKEAMPTLKYRPILAYIHQVNGVSDFYAHNIEIVEDENGDDKINYLEKQVGCFTADDPYLEYDKNMDKTYVNAAAVIPEDYTEAADIIRRKNGTKVSCELCIDELEYNAKEKYLDLTSFYFGGTTLLGCDEDGNEIGEGMLGARADITDFCHKKPDISCQDKLVEVLSKLDSTLQGFQNKNTTKEGGEEAMNKFEELLAKYGKVAEDVTFETEGLSDEELEAKFAEAFEEASEEEKVEVEESASEDGDVEEPVATEEEACGGKKKKKCSIDEDGNMSVSFEISHEDVRYALYNLIGMYEDEDNDWYFIRNVYDSYFIMENWDGDKLYKQGYKTEGDNVSLDGDRQQMFEMILTESEKLAIDKMREDYAALESKYDELVKFKVSAEQAQKDAIFADDKYVALKSSKAFAKLIEESKNYTLEECTQKADELFEDAKVIAEQFSAVDEKKSPKTIAVSFKQDNKRKDAYGGLFLSYKEKHGK